MPELPDLHIFSENLKKRILNKNIASVTVYSPNKIDTPDLLCKKLTGTNIQEIVRDGKELRFLLENNNCFSVHLMLNGRFHVSNWEDTQCIKSKIIALFFEDSQSLVISDFQGLCKITLNPRPSEAPDALSSLFTLRYFSDVIKKNAWKNIKAVLIDQHVVRGIGNAYVDEILYKAEISPESVSGKIPA